MFLFSAQGLLTIAVIALLLFGPEKLPEMARTIGRFMGEFKRAQEAMEATIRAEMYKTDTTTSASPAAAAAPAFSTASDEGDEEEEDEE